MSTTEAPDSPPVAVPVSVVIPARNCAEHLTDCLAAVDAQNYGGPLEVVIAVAPSEDGTEKVAIGAPCRWPRRVVPNPAGSTSAGLNAAIAEASGEVIVRVDAQARVPADYVARAVATLRKTDAANVGGVQRPVGDAGLQRVFAAALASPFGGGPAAFRHGTQAGPADTVYLGVFDAQALREIGGFDETLKRNQDYELNWRLREAGRIVWLDPALAVDYLPRATWSGLARQYFEYGYWKRVMLARHPRSVQPRQLAAPALVGGLVASLGLLAKGCRRGLLLPSAYAVACCGATVGTRRIGSGKLGLAERAQVGFAFAVMHLSWGAGFLVSSVAPPARWGRQRLAGLARALRSRT